MKQLLSFFTISNFEITSIKLHYLIIFFLIFGISILIINLVVYLSQKYKHKSIVLSLQKKRISNTLRFSCINNSKPLFCCFDYFKKSTFSPLDESKRAGTAFYKITKKTLPSTARRQISHVSLSGWQSKLYKSISGGNIYLRCHLVGFQLCGENSNPLNIITGTQDFNIKGMLPFEDKVCSYVKKTGKPVLYRVTPIYSKGGSIAKGVWMEAYSCFNKTIRFSVFVYNRQDNFFIDYTTGTSMKLFKTKNK